MSAVESAVNQDGDEVRVGTQVCSGDDGHYGGVEALAEEDGRVMAAVVCEDDVLRAYEVEYLGVFTVQHG